MGANPEWEDEIGNTPMETMIDDRIVSLATDEELSRSPIPPDFFDIALLFGTSSTEVVEELLAARHFTIIHDILLGIRRDLGPLREYLDTYSDKHELSELIDTPDSRGRSPLAWAVEHGWVGAARTLMQFGANPHQSRPSIHGGLPLIHLAIATPASSDPGNDVVQIVRLLLQAGVDVNCLDHEKWTPLHVAASWNNLLVIRELAAFGGDELGWNMLTYDGQSAVDLALCGGYNPEVQRILTRHLPCSLDLEQNGQNSPIVDEYVDCIE
ncbi:unnamed protein product [Clonostachys rosea]|uniref:Uncharacterized protein n=1 Tax=Bionectria ochroleuca TaxID=29856 RepID=A0ABY6UIL1_BIOOC|nr:unnamed protein product [Clonostachys rosea]